MLRKDTNLRNTREISQERNVIGGGREGKTNLPRFFVGWPVFRLNFRSQRKRELRSHATGCPFAFFTTHKRAPRAQLRHATNTRQSSSGPVSINQSACSENRALFSSTNQSPIQNSTRLDFAFIWFSFVFLFRPVVSFIVFCARFVCL